MEHDAEIKSLEDALVEITWQDGRITSGKKMRMATVSELQ
jgi:hypothetical protein